MLSLWKLDSCNGAAHALPSIKEEFHVGTADEVQRKPANEVLGFGQL